jgi:hypothetical protein
VVDFNREVAIPRRVRLLLLLAFVLSGCAQTATDRRWANVGLGVGVDETSAVLALNDWNKASHGRIDLKLVAEEDADIVISLGETGSLCALTRWFARPRPGEWATDDGEAVILLSAKSSEDCPTMRAIRHELGHYMSGAHEHLEDPAAVMYPHEAEQTGVTQMDLEYVGLR